MASRLDASTENKLDMALDELVSKDPPGGSDRGGRDRSRSHGGDRRFGRECRGGRSRSLRRSRDGGNGRRRRVPPEDKALLHTRCYFNTEGDLVVRLYDTDVFTLKQRRPTASALTPAAASAPTPAVPSNDSAATSDDAHAASKDAAKPADIENKPTDIDKVTATDSTNSVAAVETAEPKTGAAQSEDAIPVAADTAPRKEELSWCGGSAQAEKECPDISPVKGSPDVAPTSASPDAGQPNGSPDAGLIDKSPDVGPTSASPDAGPTGGTPDVAPKQQIADVTVADVDEKATFVLSSGKFRTMETRFILNEVLSLLAVRVERHGSAGSWAVTSKSKPTPEPFEDGMELSLKDPPVLPAVVKQHMDHKVREAKDRHRDSRDHPAMPPHPSLGYPGWGPPPPGPYYQLPPGWPQNPPPPHIGWPAKPGMPPGLPPTMSWRGLHAPPHCGAPPPGPGPRPMVPGGRPALPGPSLEAHRGPLPDSLFQ